MRDPQTTSSADRGFTLLEVMVVVLVIGILLAVGIPTYLGARGRAQDKAAQSSLRSGLTAASVVYTDRLDFGDADAGGLAAAEPAFTYVGPTTASTDDTELSVAATADGDRWGAAALSDSGTCFYIRADADGATTYGSSDTASCTGGQALTVLDADWSGGTSGGSGGGSATPTTAPTPVLQVSVDDATLGTGFQTDGTGYGVPNGAGFNGGGAGSTSDFVQFDFVVAEAGTYRIVGSVRSPNGNDDSFWVTVDGQPSGGYLWDTGRSSTYSSSTVRDRGSGTVEIHLEPGAHQVTLWRREDGTYVSGLELVKQN
ncbi:MAG: prepilin-type N-terminal cleavage/methylation domain-containing protein [Actinomycetota bacterium]